MGFDLTSDNTLPRLLEHWATARGNEDVLVYLVDGSQPETMGRVTWARLAEDVTRLRARLAGIGVEDQRVVVMALPNAPITVALWLAVPANGGILHAVDPDAGRITLERAIHTTEAAVVFVPASLAKVAGELVAVAASKPRLVVVPDEDLARTDLPDLGPAAGTPPSATPDMIYGLLPTSGTSGAPKLVQLTHRNYVMSAERLARNAGFSTADRHYLCSPFFHTNAQLYVCAPPFANGGSIAMVPRFSASKYFDAARWTGATVSSMVAPPMRMALHKAVESGVRPDAGSLRLITYGMQLSTADWEDWDRLLPQIAMRQIYGQTESVSGVLGGVAWERDDRRTIGRPFLGIDEVRVVRDDGTDAPDGEQGELWVRGKPGNTLMLGYRNAPEATARTLVDGVWLRTGDVMVRHPGGRFEFRGRGMHIIRRGGENLSTYALELDLQRCPLVSDVSVTAKEDPVLDAVVVAHVIPAEGYSEAAFLAWCRENMGKRSVPDHVKEHKEFPRTGSGRVVQREL